MVLCRSQSYIELNLEKIKKIQKWYWYWYDSGNEKERKNPYHYRFRDREKILQSEESDRSCTRLRTETSMQVRIMSRCTSELNCCWKTSGNCAESYSTNKCIRIDDCLLWIIKRTVWPTRCLSMYIGRGSGGGNTPSPKACWVVCTWRRAGIGIWPLGCIVTNVTDAFSQLPWPPPQTPLFAYSAPGTEGSAPASNLQRISYVLSWIPLYHH